MDAGPRIGRRAAIYLSLLAAAQYIVPSPTDGTGGGPAPAGAVRIAGGLPGGVYDQWARALADQVATRRPALTVTVLGSGGSASNLGLLARGEVTVALASIDFSARYLARHLADEPPDASPITALARLYDDYVHLVVPRRSSVRSLSDVAGRRLVVGAHQSGTSFVANRILDSLQVRPSRRVELDLSSALAALAGGEVDAVFWSGGLPTHAVRDAWARHDLRLVPLPGVADTLRGRFGAVYRAATIPAGTYARNEPVTTVALANLLLARADLRPELADLLLGTIFEGRTAIARAVPAFTAFARFSAIQSQPVPLHPGAVAFYRAQTG